MTRHTSPSRFSWLKEESARWRTAGLIDAATRDRILAEYDTVSAERRSLMALVVVAVLMCGIGLLLLIGYNWDRIPPAAKIGMILTAVAAAFGAASWCYSRNRLVLGETLAFAGTLVFGNGIWLIAQVLHIQGHFPDAFLWFGLGALACAWLVGSRWTGIAAVVLLGVWIIAESSFHARPIFAFIPVWILAVLLAYRIASPLMLSMTAFTGALWVAIATAESARGSVMAAAVLMTGCGLYAAGRWIRGEFHLGRSWRTAGLSVILITFIPLMVTEVHRHVHAANANFTSMMIALVVGLIAVVGSATRATTLVDKAVAITAAVAMMWGTAMWSGFLPEGINATRLGTVAFSILSLGMGLVLVRTALHSHLQIDLFFGVLFVMAFLVVRWVSVIENMLWSGAFLLITGAGLLWLARLWRNRPRPFAAAAEVS